MSPGSRVCTTWQSGMYRQAVPSQEPRIGVLCMRRLAAMNSPPGGFWKISRTQHFQSNNTNSAKHTYFQSYNYAINNIRRGSAPLTWNFLCLNWVVWDIPMTTTSSPSWCDHSNLTRTSLKPHQSLWFSCSNLGCYSSLPKPSLWPLFTLLNLAFSRV